MARDIYGTALKISLHIYFISSFISTVCRYYDCHGSCDHIRFNNSLIEYMRGECDNATYECYPSCNMYNMLLLRDMYDDIIRLFIIGLAIVNYKAINPNIVRYQIIRDTTLAADQIILRMEYGYDGLYYFPRIIQMILQRSGLNLTPAVCWSLACGILSIGFIMTILSYKASSQKKETRMWSNNDFSSPSLNGEKVTDTDKSLPPTYDDVVDTHGSGDLKI